MSDAQIVAFEDTWHWTEETARTYQELVEIAPANVVEMMMAFRRFVGLNDVMAYLTMMCIRLLELQRVLKATGSIYLHCDPTASHYLKILLDTIFGKTNFRNEIVWFYRRWSAAANKYQGLHDIIFFYTKSAKNIHTFNLQLMPYTAKTNKRWKGQRMHNIVMENQKLLKTPAPEEEAKGANMGDVWEISIINSQARERLGYPTQKPEPLLERIICGSSNPDDVVLDPFCGCGTAMVEAHRLKRRWIGIDITHLAIRTIKDRLNETFSIKQGIEYIVKGEPEDLTGAHELAIQNRYQFQLWALAMLPNCKPGPKGADGGCDGFIFMPEGRSDFLLIIVQVKSGGVSARDVRELSDVVTTKKGIAGILITLEKPTRNMKIEAAAKGFYRSRISNAQHPKIQILTIEDLLSGTKPDIPPPIVQVRKRAEQAPGSSQSEISFPPKQA